MNMIALRHVNHEIYALMSGCQDIKNNIAQNKACLIMYCVAVETALSMCRQLFSNKRITRTDVVVFLSYFINGL